MVNRGTISKLIFESLGELSLIIAAVLISQIVLLKFNYSYKMISLIIVLLIIGVALRIFAEEILGDSISGKIIKRISRFNK